MLFNKIKWNKLFLLGFVALLAVINLLYVSSLSEDNSLIIKLFTVTVFPHLFTFMLGILLQRNIWFVRKYLVNNGIYILIAYLLYAYFLSMTNLYIWDAGLNLVATSVLALLTISMAYSYVSKFGNFLKGNDISYGVYIYHMVIVNMLIELALFSPVLNQVMMIALTIAIATCSWKFLEKPALSLKRYSLRKVVV